MASKSKAAAEEPAVPAAPAKEDALALVPEFARADVGKGTEAITSDDMMVPRLAVANKVNPQVDPTLPEHIEGLKVGDQFNTLAEGTTGVYGTDPVEVVIVKVNGARAMVLDPTKLGNVLDYNVPLDDPRCQFGPRGEKPVATRFFEYVVWLPKTEELLMLSFKGRGLRYSKRLNHRLKSLRIPIYMARFAVSAATETGPKGPYLLQRVDPVGPVNDVEQIRKLKAIYDTLKDKKVEAADVDAHDADEGAGAGDASFNPDEM